MFKIALLTIAGALVAQTQALAQIYVKSTGVGIGTSTPATKFHVIGRSLLESNDGDVLTFNSPSTSAWQFISFNKGGLRKLWMGLSGGTDFHIRNEQPGHIYLQPFDGKVVVESSIDNGNAGGSLILRHPGKTASGAASDWAVYNMTGIYGNSLQFWAYGTDLTMRSFVLRDNGYVGVGLFPYYKLHVDGDIKAASFIGNVNTYADYVFDSTYQLPALHEVESYIKQNHHLPDVPSEETVKKEGINLNEHQVVLLKKIEELTLYIIEQNKKIEEQGKKQASWEQQFKLLQEEINLLKEMLKNK
jgi:hypothetical protein